MAQDDTTAPRGRPCMVCGVAPASFGLAWPGFRDKRPPAIRDARVFRHCGAVECTAQGIARMISAARAPFPWSATLYSAGVRERVAAIQGADAPAPPETSPASPPSPPESNPQGVLL